MNILKLKKQVLIIYLIFKSIIQKVDTISKLFEDVIAQTQEYLQPNPAYRAKLMTMNTLNKLQGKSKCAAYPQPENQLGECMVKFGRDLGPDSCYGMFNIVFNTDISFLITFSYLNLDLINIC